MEQKNLTRDIELINLIGSKVFKETRINDNRYSDKVNSMQGTSENSETTKYNLNLLFEENLLNMIEITQKQIRKEIQVVIG